MEVPKARGTGRSGPRRRTGCMTCRARKVRCDETKPACANCGRLRLRCVYKSSVGLRNGSWGSSRMSSHESAAAAHAASQSAPTSAMGPASAAAAVEAAATASQRSPDLNFFNTVLRSEEHHRGLAASASPIRRIPPQTESYPPDLGGHFDMIGFMGGITSDLEQKHLDLTSELTAFDNGPTPQSLQPGVAANSTEEAPLVEEGRSTMSPDASSSLADGMSIGNASDGVVTRNDEFDPGTWEEQLTRHYMTIPPPATIFGPVNMEWKYVQSSILAQAQDSGPLMNALWCYTDVHKARSKGKQFMWAPTYYRLASSKLQGCLLGDVSDSTLVKIFGAVFFLMLSELFSSPEICSPGTSYLHSAYLLLQRFHDRTRTWTGLGHLLVSWVSLLDVKSLIAGRDGDPLIELGNITEAPSSTKFLAAPKAASLRTVSNEHKDETIDDPFLSPSYLVYEAIVGPAFRFFVQAQQVVRRIVCIDLHHRSRGTLSDEFEVLQVAHKVGADLETLWHRRPSVIDVYGNPEALTDTLCAPVALEICRTFRQYVANFLANFIYLHRVAFAIYPRTDRVNGAVDQIIQLATVESAGVGAGHLPVSFLWPLFVAGLEGSSDQRQWIVQEMQRMATAHAEDKEGMASMSRHPTADKVLLLLEEMTRRQDKSRTWADSRCVRRELFSDFFVMI